MKVIGEPCMSFDTCLKLFQNKKLSKIRWCLSLRVVPGLAASVPLALLEGQVARCTGAGAVSPVLADGLHSTCGASFVYAARSS